MLAYHRHLSASGSQLWEVLGDPVDESEYRGTLKGLAVLLLHIACARSDTGSTPPAVWDVEQTFRWHLHPPQDPSIRGDVITRADQIITSSTLDEAAAKFQPWFDAIPPVWEGKVSWAADHTHATPPVARIIRSSGTTRQRLSHRLNDAPQLGILIALVPGRLNKGHLLNSEVTGLSVSTARAFATLCLARANPTATSWADAAKLLGLSPEIGNRLGRTASAQLTIGLDGWINHLQALASQLNAEQINYRERERCVYRVLGNHSDAVLKVLQAVRPGTWASSNDLIVHWMWVHWAQGHPSTSPVPTVVASRASRVRYAQFQHSLTSRHATSLQAWVEDERRRADQ